MRALFLIPLLLVSCEEVPVFDEPDDRCSDVLKVRTLQTIDGDTLEVEYLEGDREGYVDRVRLIGIDATEVSSADCYSEIATNELARLAGGHELYLVHDLECTDNNGRVLAYVYRVEDELFINEQLVAGGFASSCPFEPNTFHRETFDRLEAEAHAAQRGQWGEPCWRELGQCFGMEN